MQPAISLVITSYNREDYLKDAIESVLKQTYPDFDLLIWDDGSSDNSVDVAFEYAKSDCRVKVIAAEHQGSPHCLKAAIAQTNGVYLGWVDSDDLLSLTALEETKAVLDADPEVGMVYTDYMDIDENGKVLGYGKRCGIPYSPERLLLDFMTFHFRLIRRSVFEQVGGIDETAQWVEDYDLCLRLSEATQVSHITKPLYFYRHHSHSISNQKRLEQIFSSRDAIARAIERRGMSDRFEIELQIIGKFFLREVIRKAPG